MSNSDDSGCILVIGIILAIAALAALLGIMVYNLASVGYYVFYFLDKLFYVSSKIPLLASYGIFGSIYGFLLAIIIVARKKQLPSYIPNLSYLLIATITLLAYII
ncbi:MAG: hypothetical protein HBSAPP04_00300 [Ignavibacteriaceae bacterium]|nr:MAG: hypothetical protein HBSAPP04_00300 [Ignavibacteriaceae bacterium]